MKKKDLFWGLLFIFAALLIILNGFGIFPGISMFEIITTVILVGVMIKSMKHINFWGVLFPLAFLCILYADEWGIRDLTPWPVLLTALLLSIGLSLIFKKPAFRKYPFHGKHDFQRQIIDEQDTNVVTCSSSFGESMKYVNTENFEQANIKCSFGASKVYFDNAQIPSGKADIYLDVSFGEAELFFPKTWRVVNHAQVFLGGIEEKNQSNGSDAPVVTIQGNVSFGAVQIIYV